MNSDCTDLVGLIFPLTAAFLKKERGVRTHFSVGAGVFPIDAKMLAPGV